jgi:hypothetical protein
MRVFIQSQLLIILSHLARISSIILNYVICFINNQFFIHNIMFFI